MENVVPSLSLIPALMLAGSAMAQPVDNAEMSYVTCAEGRGFGLRIEGQYARVRLADGDLVLARQPSSIGQHFRNREATLILDDSFVAFVQKSDLDWQDCHIATLPVQNGDDPS